MGTIFIANSSIRLHLTLLTREINSNYFRSPWQVKMNKVDTDKFVIDTSSVTDDYNFLSLFNYMLPSRILSKQIIPDICTFLPLIIQHLVERILQAKKNLRKNKKKLYNPRMLQMIESTIPLDISLLPPKPLEVSFRGRRWSLPSLFTPCTYVRTYTHTRAQASTAIECVYARKKNEKNKTREKTKKILP